MTREYAFGDSGRAHIVPNDGTPPTARVRASSWSQLFDCAHAWEGTHIMGMRKPSGMAAHLGTAIHHGTAVFDEARMAGKDADVFNAIDAFNAMLDNPRDEVDLTRGTMTLREARATGTALVNAYCRDVSPKFTFSAVELKMSPIRVQVDRVVIEITGSLDRSRTVTLTSDVTGLSQLRTATYDIKTGARVVEQGRASIKGRSAQLGAYELMTECATGQSSGGAGIIALPTSGKPIPVVSPLWDARRVMAGTESEPGLIEVAAAMFSTGLFPPNPSSRLCSATYCARFERCSYREPVLAED
jgi:hypothetical protein